MNRELQIAQHRFEVGDVQGAMQALRLILSEDPDHALAHAMLAGCLLNVRRIHAALNEAEIALALEPEQFLGRLMRAQILIAHRRFDEAREILDELIAEQPEEASLCRAMADLHLLRGVGGGRERQQWLARALELDPDNASTLADCAHYHLHRGELEMADLMATRALQSEPEHLGGAWIRGEVLQAQGDLDGAREHAAWVLSRNAEHRGAIALLARIKARRSALLGAWWRFVSWVSLGGEGRAILILVGMYVAYSVSSLTLELEGYTTAYTVLNIVWIAFVIYCLVAPYLFRRALERELASVTLKRDF